MLILNEEGVTCWTLPHTVMQLMHASRGESSRLNDEPEQLVAQASFVNFFRDPDADVTVHQLGHAIVPGADTAAGGHNAKARQRCCEILLPAHARFCSKCGLPADKARQNQQKCRSCGKALPPNARFCGQCGTSVAPEATCSNCKATLPSGVKFCGQCGTAAA